MIPNGVDGIKGHVADAAVPESLPSPIRRMADGLQKDQAIAAFNERYKIVAKCSVCNRYLIAEEHLAHLMNHTPPRSRALVRTLMAAPREVREEVLAELQALKKAGF